MFALLNEYPYFVVRWQGAHQLDFDCQPDCGGHGAMRDRRGKRDSHCFLPDRDVLQGDDLQLLQGQLVLWILDALDDVENFKFVDRVVEGRVQLLFDALFHVVLVYLLELRVDLRSWVFQLGHSAVERIYENQIESRGALLKLAIMP